MNEFLNKVLSVATIAVVIAGAILLLLLIVYAIMVLWVRVSAFSANLSEYIFYRNDFRRYIERRAEWEDDKSAWYHKCDNCYYRTKMMTDKE